MLLSFSPTSPTDYATGEHLRDHPDLIGFDVDNFTPETHTYSMEESLNKQGEKRYELIIEEKPTPPENDSQKKSRIKSLLISATDISKANLEGVKFSDIEKDEIINQKVYGGRIIAEVIDAKRTAQILDLAITKRTKKDTDDLIAINARYALVDQITTKLK